MLAADFIPLLPSRRPHHLCESGEPLPQQFSRLGFTPSSMKPPVRPGGDCGVMPNPQEHRPAPASVHNSGNLQQL